jgi:plasmid stabilization system protein ParE
MKVLWTEAALGQLQTIYDHIARTSPDYALHLVDRLTRKSIQMATFPFSGRMVPEYELNELREVIEGSYRIIYLINVEESRVEVLALIHGSRDVLSPLG